MLSLVTFVVLCLLWGKSEAVEEELETDQFIDALCVPDTRKAIANCADLLPQTGKDAVYDCGRNISETFQDNMLLAAETFCDREDLRDQLFLCWEKGLSELYESSREEEVEEEISRGMDDFQYTHWRVRRLSKWEEFAYKRFLMDCLKNRSHFH